MAIVTGAAQGIGRAIANLLSEVGASVVIGDIQDSGNTVKEIRDHATEILTKELD